MLGSNFDLFGIDALSTAACCRALATLPLGSQLAIDWARLRVTSANLVKVATVFKILSIFATSTQDASLPLLCASTTWSVTLAEGSPVTKFTFDITRLSVAEASLGWWQTQTATQLR